MLLYSQTLNLAHTLRGQRFLGNILPQNIAQITSFLVNKTVGPKDTKIVLFLFYPHFLLYINIDHCFPQFYCIGPTILPKKSSILQQEVNFRQTASVHFIILPQEGKILHGQCPCVCDKFHVCLAHGQK